MVAIPNAPLFNALHQRWIEYIKFYQELIDAQHAQAPPEADHPHNVEKLIASIEAEKLIVPTILPILSNESLEPGPPIPAQPPKRRGRPIQYAEYAGLDPHERNKKVRALYQRNRRATEKAARQANTTTQQE